MPSVRSLFFVALALAGAAHAADDICDEDFTIESDGDVNKIQECTKLKGDLTIGEKVGSVNIANLEVIEGDLKAHTATALTTISAPRLTSISGEFSLKRLTLLDNLQFPELQKVGGINWETLPALKALNFAKGVTEAGSVRITDTQLSSLEGLRLSQVESFDINNNKFLTSVETQLTSVREALTVAFNGKGVQASFPELKWARNITVRDASSISFPKLEKVNASIAFVNTTFEEASFPKLKSVGDLSLISCTKLSNLSVNALEEVTGTLIIANNTKLAEIKGLSKLESVGGSIDISGALEEVELPSLNDVSGSFNLQSTKDLDCEPFDAFEESPPVVKGEYKCESELDVAESTEGGVSTEGDGSSGSGSSNDDDESSAAGLAKFGLATIVGTVVAFVL